MIEDLAYRRLLDHYYLHEVPIKQREIARQIGMRDNEQEVLSILNEFFVSTDAGFINPKADKIIANYHEMIAAGKRGAAKRWQSPPNSHPIALPNAIPIATINHKPLTNNHKPLTTKEKPHDKPADDLFDTFWKAYPKKLGKDLAKTSFSKRKVNKELLQQMLSAIDQQKSTDQWKKDGGQFIPAPATWLNQGRWQDEVTSVQQSTLPRYK
jgi:uncharacterized protein YdaU (DUF1376 family)